VSVIVPTVGTSKPVWGVDRPLVLGAVESVLAVTDYPDVEVVVVADPETPADVLEQLQSLDCTVVRGEGRVQLLGALQPGRRLVEPATCCCSSTTTHSSSRRTGSR
jgi:hypothetical protein